ncbi:MAG: peptidoglycan-binding protein [Lachnospiraceae bacterium]
MEYSQANLHANEIDTGQLQLRITSTIGSAPIQDAEIEISYSGDPDSVIEKVTTDSSGHSEIIDLKAPPLEYSMTPGSNQPYSEYTFKITARDYDSIVISGSEILPNVTSIQEAQLVPVELPAPSDQAIVIGPHTLYGEYPPKIPESEIKTVEETGEIVLSRVVVPEYIIVHDGAVGDSTAINYYDRYRDYIKNVASSEIYATWPEDTIYANVLAILSFTMNRVYTEWYRNKGYDFTITSSTAYDHKWIHGRNIFDTIDRVVDSIFNNYLSFPGVQQPILTQYCDGKRVTCPEWMSQWGSKYLGDEGYSAIEILRYYYGDSIYINSAQEIAGIPSSWPGQDLTIGSSGDKVRQMQEQLNRIAKSYPAIPTIRADGQYGAQTAAAVRKFQEIFGLPQTGVVDFRTWYKISQIYVGVSRIAELR